MSYIEKEKLIKADIDSIENRVRHAFNQGYDLGYKEGKERAKSQEQKPILDKIRAEIDEYKSRQLTLAIGVEDLEEGKQIALEYVLAILDKYKAESENT